MNRRDFLSWAGKISILAAIVPKVDIKEPLPIHETLHLKYTTPTAVTLEWKKDPGSWQTVPLNVEYITDSTTIADFDRDPF